MIEATLQDDDYNPVTVNSTPGTGEIYLIDLKDKAIVVLSDKQQRDLLIWLLSNDKQPYGK